MGAGATAGVQSVIDETSLNDTLSKLSIDEKLAFWTAVSESDAKAAIEGSEQLKEEFGKLPEENQTKFVEVITSVSNDPATGAPFMELANAKGKLWAKEATKDLTPEEMAVMDKDPDKKKEWAGKYREYVNENLKSIYQKVFDRHDVDKSGKINKEQASALFKNFAAMAKDGIEFAMTEYAETIALSLLGEGEHSEDDKKAKAEKVKASIGPACEAILKTYNDDSAKVDDAVFAVLAGEGGDGISFDNFLELFMDGSDLQKQAAEPFGFGEAAVMAKIAEVAA